MLPELSLTSNVVEVIPYADRTYKIDWVNKRIIGYIDGIDSILQAVTKILMTERYAYLIYSDNYGVEFNRLVGADYSFILSDIQRTLTDSLAQDDRFIDITNFSINKSSIDSLEIKITVNTNLGKIDYEGSVTI